jgi:membrane peptidoglycan carboxypeptidase
MSPPRGGRRPATDPILLQRLRKRRRERVKNRRRRSGRLVLGILLGTLIFLVVSSFTGAAIFMSSCDLDSLKPVEVGENSFVYAADGSLLGSIPAERNRQPVALSKISPWVPLATVAIEDRRFFSHGALDYLGIVRALYADVKAGKVVQGGSTITQQLVRNLYIKKKSQTLGRKATEACLAIKLARQKESQYGGHAGKQWILTAYMNQVYYGNHAYGIEAAAQTYFSKPARKRVCRRLRRTSTRSMVPQRRSRAAMRSYGQCSTTTTSRRASTRMRSRHATCTSRRVVSTRAFASRTSSATCVTSW